MEATELLDEILKNYTLATTVSQQIQAHQKNIALLNGESKKAYDKGYKDGKRDGKKEKIDNLIQKN
ncbi:MULTISPECIES: hypothetical protein [unclassified Chryseobacterium]|uniref:hypothetical protein n=1 Tax=unclassified Chryseobacterium TaxID=2593645 RepID=UPI001A39BD26|nr:MULTISPECIES: hypothetical protein [unclassified Chryseobacterium]MBL7878318.1 hypothetical protein [Chryseobacterium gambrini]MCQ4138959.1 hypothetical protein [Chryseobacterium sp. EO14]QWA37287.1 hypothetical protein KKI44_15275 [Chryseobacterium sp. ZHDP1]